MTSNKSLKFNKIKSFIIFIILLAIKDLLFCCLINSKTFNNITIHNMVYAIFNNKLMFLFHSLPLILILSFGLLLKKKPYIYYLIIDFLFSSLIVLNLWSVRSTGNFLTINFIFNHFKVIRNSILSTNFLQPLDIFFMLDILIIIFVLIFIKYKNVHVVFSSCKIAMMIIFISSSFGIVKIFSMDKNGTLSFSINESYWEPYTAVYETSPLIFHLTDIRNKLTDPKRNLSKENYQIITDWLINNKETVSDNSYKGLFKNKNLIIIQVEAFESFPISNSIIGQEITPNINKLLKESLNFTNIYDQTNGGVSSDADLLINTSIFPIRHKSTFLSYGDTIYNSLPKLLENLNYETLMLHGEVGGNWNFKVSDSYIGFNKVFDLNSFNIPKEFQSHYESTTDNLILQTFISKVKNLKQPFFGHVVTLDSHAYFQYIPTDKYKLNLPIELKNSYLGNYLQSINYVDSEIGNFINTLKEEGLYDDSIIVITGDHGGYKKYCLEEMNKFIDKYPWIGNDSHPKVPLIIHSKGFEGKTFDIVGGQIDIMPTLCYLLGVDRTDFNTTAIGKILVNTDRNFALLNGDIIVGSGDENTINHYKKAFTISDLIIKSNYFKNRNYIKK